MTECSLCGKPVSRQSPGVWRQVTGWTRRRKAGGTNAVALRQETGRLAHAACVDAVKDGRSPHQIQMF